MAKDSDASPDTMRAVPLDQARADKLRAVPLDQLRRAQGKSIVALPRSKVASLRAFRRIHADRAFGILGTVLVIVGVILVFAWQKPPPVEKKFGVEWPIENKDALTDTKLLAQGQSQDYAVKVADPNVTQVTFWLVWKDNVPTPGSDQTDGDTFELSVQAPSTSNFTLKEARTGGSAGMNMSYSLPMSGLPDVNSVKPANNEVQARKLLGDRSNQTGTGDWKVTVRLVSANDTWSNNDARAAAAQRGTRCPAGGIPNTCVADPGNDYTIFFQYSFYHSVLKKQF